MKEDGSDVQSKEESLVEHLTELRVRLIRAVLIVLCGAAASWVYSERIFDLIRRPIAPFLLKYAGEGGGLVFTAPMDKFLAHVKVSLLSGVILTTPLWFFQLWKFVAPGLYAHEKRYGLGFIFSGSLLFLTGISFAYFVVYPLAFDFLMSFGGEIDRPMITISEYLSFFMTTTILFGLAFELPLIFTVLSMMGLVDRQFLAKNRRYAIVLLAVLSAVITPPDILSMLLMMGPMLLLYELSILLVGIFGKKPDNLTAPT